MEEREDIQEEKVSEEEVKEEVHEEKEETVSEEVHEEEKKEEVNDLENTQEVVRPAEPVKKKKVVLKLIVVLLVIILLCVIGYMAYTNLLAGKENKIKTKSKEYQSEYRMSGNGLEDFDLYFLKLENKKENMIYSPLSIKYALEMLAEGADGESKAQLDAVIGDYKAKKYPNNQNMAFANAMFIRNSYKENIKDEYIKNLQNKYGAEIIYDDFASAANFNNWVNEKTLKLIDKLYEDKDVAKMNFILANALAIDMNWTNQIHCATGSDVPCYNDGIYHIYYLHEKLDDERETSYSVSDYPYTSDSEFFGMDFNGKSDIKRSQVLADFNNYDIIKELGEDKIRKTVEPEYKKWLETSQGKNAVAGGYGEPDVNKYMDQYIKEISENKGKGEHSTDFMLYTDSTVKAFAKDLQTYDGVTLQYVGIMPIKDELSSYIENVKAEDLTEIIGNLKELKNESFKDGYATVIRGNIPLFKYDYKLDFMNDLKELGIKDIFSIETANLEGMLKKGEKQYIDDASHKATIDFSNDGIKAGAVTAMGGFGATSGGFEYLFKVPVEEIDISFDKPYMYIIRDKDSGEVWFTGAVYEPTSK